MGTGDGAPLRTRVTNPLATGFAVSILDDATAEGLPLGWSPLGYPNSVRASVGRLGGAVRLRGGTWPADADAKWAALDDGPPGIRQGVFLPAARCRDYRGSIWLRIASMDDDAQGQLEERRPTYANTAWGGLEYNIIGTGEYIRFCQLTGVEPYIIVNTGTAPAEEAAAWVEYCNGPVTTPMGSLRAKNGHAEPYNVRIWEVGNENFGYWQGGYVGSEENARRFAEFATAMRSASPIPIELIACGSNFDFAQPGADYDHVTADRRWHDSLFESAPNDIDYISLQALPVNDHMLERLGISKPTRRYSRAASAKRWATCTPTRCGTCCSCTLHSLIRHLLRAKSVDPVTTFRHPRTWARSIATFRTSMQSRVGPSRAAICWPPRTAI